MDNSIVFYDTTAPSVELLQIFPCEVRRCYNAKITGANVEMIYHSSEVIVSIGSPTGPKILSEALQFLLDDSIDIVCTFRQSNFSTPFNRRRVNLLEKQITCFFPYLEMSNQYCGKNILPLPTNRYSTNIPGTGGSHESLGQPQGDHIFMHRQ